MTAGKTALAAPPREGAASELHPMVNVLRQLILNTATTGSWSDG